MHDHIELTNRKLKSLIDNGRITLGGNKPWKIYGTLSCNSGKRMKKENRVFFSSEQEAVNEGYRPCGHCMRTAHRKWKEKGNLILDVMQVRGISEASSMENFSPAVSGIKMTNALPFNPSLSSDNSLPPRGSVKS